MFSFEVTCEPMDLEISFRKGADETRARRSDGEAAATTYADEDDEARFILHRGALEHPEMLGVYANDSLSFGLFPHEDALNADVDAIESALEEGARDQIVARGSKFVGVQDDPEAIADVTTIGVRHTLPT